MTAVKQNVFNVHKSGDGFTKPTISMKSEVHTGRVVEPDEE
jgi:hypothetical protein